MFMIDVGIKVLIEWFESFSSDDMSLIMKIIWLLINVLDVFVYNMLCLSPNSA